MGRKKVSEMNAEELEKYREYMRKAKARNRKGKEPETDKRTYADRKEYQRNYMREYRKRKKDELNDK